MNKRDLIDRLATKHNLSKAQTQRLLEDIVEIASTELVKRGEFTMPGLVKIIRVEKKARVGRNPLTGQSVDIPAKTVAKAKVVHPVNSLAF